MQEKILMGKKVVCDSVKEYLSDVSTDELEEKMPEGCRIAILAISMNIQATVDRLIACGITGLVDFTHEHIQVPKGVVLKTVDVVSSIQELVFETNSLNIKR